jgi:hypothetical protein
MASARDLALLLPAPVAEKVGWSSTTLTTTSTAQGGATVKGRGQRIVKVTAHAGDGSVTLPADAAEHDEIIIVNVSASNSADVFPPSGHNFQGLNDNVGVAVAASATLHCIYLGSTLWMSRLGAAAVAT